MLTIKPNILLHFMYINSFNFHNILRNLGTIIISHFFIWSRNLKYSNLVSLTRVWKTLYHVSGLKSLKGELLYFRTYLNHLTLMFIDRLIVHLRNACCNIFLHDWRMKFHIHLWMIYCYDTFQMWKFYIIGATLSYQWGLLL